MMCLKGGVLVLTFARSWFFNYLKLEANAVGFVEFLKYCMSCCCRCLYRSIVRQADTMYGIENPTIIIILATAVISSPVSLVL